MSKEIHLSYLSCYYKQLHNHLVMKNSSSSEWLSVQSDQDTSYAKINEQWIHSSIHAPKELLICPICYEFSYEPIECAHCNRLFCKQDYFNTKQIKNSCPLCKASPWVLEKSIHISYKRMIQEVRFKCQVCKKKNLSNHQLEAHLKTQHKLGVKRYEVLLYDFTLVFDDGRKVPLTFHENLEINYRMRILKKTLFGGFIDIYSDQEKQLVLNTSDLTFGKLDGTKGKLIKKKSTVIKPSQQYIVWVVFSDKGETFLRQKDQATLQNEYNAFIKNPRFCEIYLDVPTKDELIRYRIMFSSMSQVNTMNQYKRKIKRQKIVFES